MAAGNQLNFQIYQEQMQAGIVETLVQNSNLFNAATNGAIIYGTEAHRGDFVQNAFFKNTAGLFQRRDPNSLAAVTDNPITQAQLNSVALSRRIGPVAQTRDSFRKIMAGRAEDEMSFILGTQLGRAMEISMVDDALSALVAALKNQPTNYVDGTATVLTTDRLFEGLAKFGDASSQIVAWVMTSKQYFDLTRGQVAANIDGVSNFNIATATPVTLNRPVIVTDAVSLLNGANQYCLGLTQGAAEIMDRGDTYMTFDEVTGLENIVLRWVGEAQHTLGLKGFSWDIAVGGANPTAAALSTGTNWLKEYDSHKSLSGIAIETL